MNGPRRDAQRRPPLDALEVRFPRAASLAVRLLGHMPRAVRRRALAGAFARAQGAFNRGDLEAVFALFAADVEYVPPPALHRGPPLHGHAAVLGFWREVLARYAASTIENLSLEQTDAERFVRTARLTHAGAAGVLEYVIRQTTDLRAGRVVRQINEAAQASDDPSAPPPGHPAGRG